MLTYNHFLLVGLGAGSQTNRLVDPNDKSYLHLTFAGKTYQYASQRAGFVTERDSTRLWYFDLGANRNCFLSIALCGDRAGSYPFGHDQSSQSGISLLTYCFGDSVYSSYSNARQENGMRASGTIHLQESVSNQVAQGTFAGVLTNHNGTPCARPISGQFCVRQ